MSDEKLIDQLYAPSIDSADSKALDDRVDVDIISCFYMSDGSGVTGNGGSEDSIDELLKHSMTDTQSSEVNAQKVSTKEMEEIVIPTISKMTPTANSDEKTEENIESKGNQKERITPTGYSSNTDTNQSHKNQKETVSMKEYQSLQQQLAKWKSTAYRWQNMAKLQDAQRDTMQRRESKYKQKIWDQQHKILSLTKRLRQKEYDLGKSMRALKAKENEMERTLSEFEQYQDESARTINDLIGYKEKNEYRRTNSYCDGTLWKFTGENMSHMKWNKAPKLKYVMYVPTKRILYHSESVHDDADSKLVNVTYISHQNADIERLLPSKYRGRWIKIIGES